MKDPNSPPGQLEIDFEEKRFLKIDEIPLNSFWVSTSLPGNGGYSSAVKVVDTETYRDVHDVVVQYVRTDGTREPPYLIDAFKLQYRYLFLPKNARPEWMHSA